MKYSRQLKYYYLRFIRLRGAPNELALGMAFGIFSGMMPIMPFQIALAVTLALFYKGSKITAALGTWISNPLNWYFLYFFSYKIGAWILGLSGKGKTITSVLTSLQEGEEAGAVMAKMAGASGAMISAFLVGGIIMGIVAAVPSYFIFLKIFQSVLAWREKRKERKRWRKQNPQKKELDSGRQKS